MKLKNITVATEKYGYYNIMEESCKRHNIELITLGMGQKWEGFTMRFKLWLNYLNELDDNEIVMINDAYDVIMLEDAEDIIKKFKSFDKKIIFSAQDSILSKILFPICNLEKKVICAGNMIGYVKYLKKLINLLFEKKSLWEKFNKDDQVVINHLCNVEQS